MDIQGFANAATLSSQAQVGEAVGLSVLKKALDIQSSSAMALIQSIPDIQSGPTTAQLPDHIGRNLNVSA